MFNRWYNNLEIHWFSELKKAKKLSNKLYYTMLDTDKSLYLAWKENAKNEFPNIDDSLKTYAKCLHALLIYFYIASKIKEQTVLPSLAADSVWHIWIDSDPKGLATFQKKHFGKEMKHVEKKNMSKSEPEYYGQARTWNGACNLEDINILSAKIPYLYKVDEILKMPGGWIYKYNKKTKKIGVAQLDIYANPISKTYESPAFVAATFLTLGMISTTQYQHYNHKKSDSSSSGIGFSSDSSGDGGSCGGGCG